MALESHALTLLIPMPLLCCLVGKASLDAENRGLDAKYTKKGKKESMKVFYTYAKMRAMVRKLAEDYSVILAPGAVAVHIPAFVGVNGMPVGISLVAPSLHDYCLLRVSKILGEALMAEGGWKL
ncbi:hypothetical protein PENFLA_c037G10698 [Penicillium flavigenum]|uniref:Amidase domain-containing protein n=1 Tax=Penicillium flavigenum TaxID=254877 RepID=A0A1V6SKU6_9EURO|nr:hypothetical protein PENFLA_c037G10698 [Penicillium flavigenum]